MKVRRHHNNKGYRQIKNGKTQKWADLMNRGLQRILNEKGRGEDK